LKLLEQYTLVGLTHCQTLTSPQPIAHCALIFDIRGVGWHCWSSSTLKPLFKLTYLWWRHYIQNSNCLAISCLAFSCPAISCPAISCLVIRSVIFMSCIFMPCYMVRQFQVRLFHVRHFQRPVIYIIIYQWRSQEFATRGA